LNDAIAAYSEAVKKEPDFGPSQYKLYYAYLADGQYDKAEKLQQVWEAPCASKGCANAYWAKANAFIYRGQLRDGLTWLDKAIADDVARSTDTKPNSLDLLHNAKAQTLLAMDSLATGDAESAIRYLLKIRPDDKVNFRPTFVRSLAREGNIDSAARVVEQLRKDVEADHLFGTAYWTSKGYLEFEQHHYVSAAESFGRAASLNAKSVAYMARHLQGQALLMAGQAAKAVAILAEQEKSFSEYRTRDCYSGSRLYYHLARAYEASGRIDSAIAKYEKFLGIWEKADPDLKEYVDARARLTRLKANP